MPTDVLSGLSQYNFVTSLADFPRGSLGMYKEAKKDSTVLKHQFKTNDALKELEPFYEKKRDYVVKQAGRTTDLIRKLKPLDLEPIDRDLKQFFSGLRWASWQWNSSRKTALEQLINKRKK